MVSLLAASTSGLTPIFAILAASTVVVVNPAPVWLAFAILGAFVVVFPTFWCGVVWLLSRIGDWHALALRYSAGARRPEGQAHGGVSGRIGGVNYNHVLRVQVAPDGLFLDVMVLFRPGHPALFIPWSEIVERKEQQFFWKRFTVLRVGQPKVGTVSLMLPEAVLQPQK